MVNHGFMTSSEVTDIVAIAEMTPGSLGINCATFAGMRVAGIPGEIFATLGVLTPTFTLCVLAAIFFKKMKNNRYMAHAMYAIRPATIGLILSAVYVLGKSAYFPQASFNLTSLLIGFTAFYLLTRHKLSIPKVICCAALLGILFCYPLQAFYLLFHPFPFSFSLLVYISFSSPPASYILLLTSFLSLINLFS